MQQLPSQHDTVSSGSALSNTSIAQTQRTNQSPNILLQRIARTTRVFSPFALALSLVLSGCAEDGAQANENVAATGESEDPIVIQFDTGHYEQQTYFRVPLLFYKVCNSNGTDCANATLTGAKAAIDFANSIEYRSDSGIRFVASKEAQFAQINDDGLNNKCLPRSDFASKANNGDPNGNGVKGDANDTAYMCPPVTEAAIVTQTITDYFANQAEEKKAVPVFMRGGVESATFSNNMWTANGWSTMYSGCDQPGVFLGDTISANFVLPHELGHYYCLAHTHYDRGSDLNVQTVAEARNAIVGEVLTHDPLSWTLDKQDVLDSRFDNDINPSTSSNAYWLNLFPIHDTPPDPGPNVWDDAFAISGVKHLCDVGNKSLDIVANLGPWGTQSFHFAPDRRNIMSYFNSCAGWGDYLTKSPDQVARQEAAASIHRTTVSNVVNVDSWVNDKDVAIPGQVSGTPKKYATSLIRTTPSDAASITRVLVHVDIKHDVGGLDISLVNPEGNEFVLQAASANTGKIVGDVKSIFYLNRGWMNVVGTWALKVTDANTHATVATRKLDAWRIELE